MSTSHEPRDLEKRRPSAEEVCVAVAAKLDYYKRQHSEPMQQTTILTDKPCNNGVSPSTLPLSQSANISQYSNESKVQLPLERPTPSRSFLLPSAPPPSPGNLLMDSELPLEPFPSHIPPSQAMLYLNEPIVTDKAPHSITEPSDTPLAINTIQCNVPEPIMSSSTPVPLMTPSDPTIASSNVAPPISSLPYTPYHQSSLPPTPSFPPIYPYPASNPMMYPAGSFIPPYTIVPVQPPVMTPVLPVKQDQPVVQQTNQTTQNQQTSNNTNVTVVNTVLNGGNTATRQKPSSTYLCTSILLLLLCAVLNPLALTCGLMALTCSCIACYYNNYGRYRSAKRHGRCALVSNITTLVFGILFVLLVVPVIIVVIVVVIMSSSEYDE